MVLSISCSPCGCHEVCRLVWHDVTWSSRVTCASHNKVTAFRNLQRQVMGECAMTLGPL